MNAVDVEKVDIELKARGYAVFSVIATDPITVEMEPGHDPPPAEVIAECLAAPDRLGPEALDRGYDERPDKAVDPITLKTQQQLAYEAALEIEDAKVRKFAGHLLNALVRGRKNNNDLL